MSEGKKLDQWIPKDLAINQPVKIPLHPEIKLQIEAKEINKENEIQTYKDEVQRLTEALEESQKLIDSLESYKIYCTQSRARVRTQADMKITILECAEKVRKRKCRGCPDRNAILENLFPVYGAKTRSAP